MLFADTPSGTTKKDSEAICPGAYLCPLSFLKLSALLSLFIRLCIFDTILFFHIQLSYDFYLFIFTGLGVNNDHC